MDRLGRSDKKRDSISVINPENYLLLYLAVRPQPTKRRRTFKDEYLDLSPLELKDLNFHHLVDQAIKNKFVPQLYNFLSENLDEEIFGKNKYLDHLRQLFFFCVVENKRLFNEFNRVMRTMNYKGIDAMPIKGSALMFFPHFGGDRRQTGDIDLLIPTRTMYEKARAELLKMNYLPNESDLQTGMGYGWAPHLDRKINEKGFRVDLHEASVSRQNWAGRPSMNIPEIWRRRVERNISGIKVYLPSPEDCVRISSAHIFGEVLEELSLRTLSDITGILRLDHNTFDWRYLVQAFTQSRSEIDLYFPLRILYRSLLEVGVLDLVPDLEKVLDELDLHHDLRDKQRVEYWRTVARFGSLSFPMKDVFEHMYEHPFVWLSFWGCLQP